MFRNHLLEKIVKKSRDVFFSLCCLCVLVRMPWERAESVLYCFPQQNKEGRRNRKTKFVDSQVDAFKNLRGEFSQDSWSLCWWLGRVFLSHKGEETYSKGASKS